MLVHCNECKTDDNDDNDDGDSNANRHVCQLPCLQAQLIGSYKVSTVNGMTCLYRQKQREFTVIYVHFQHGLYQQRKQKSPDFLFIRKQYTLTITLPLLQYSWILMMIMNDDDYIN